MGGKRIVDGPKNPKDFRPTGSSIVDGPKNPRGFRPSRPNRGRGRSMTEDVGSMPVFTMPYYGETGRPRSSEAEQQRLYNEQKIRRAEDKFKARQLRAKLQQYLAARNGFR